LRSPPLAVAETDQVAEAKAVEAEKRIAAVAIKEVKSRIVFILLK
jgi:hypothetical protein